MRRYRARDAIDKEWILTVRKTWKTLLKQQDLEKTRKWVLRLAHDLAFSKGFFTLSRAKEEESIVYKIKHKSLMLLKECVLQLGEGVDYVKFWENTLSNRTAMTMSHWFSVIQDLAKKQGVKLLGIVETTNWAKENPKLVEREKDRIIQEKTKEVLKEVDKVFSQGFLGFLSKTISKWKSPIEFGSFEREFNIGNVKVVFVDINEVFPEKDRGHTRLPYLFEKYIKELQKAERLLKDKGLGFLWYGEIFIDCKSCGGTNPFGQSYGVGAHYHIPKDRVVIFDDPSPSLSRLIAHELGHRYYYKFMNEIDRARFDSWFKNVPSVSQYGGESSSEDFAEVFSYYIENKDLTRDQLDRFKQFLRGKSASEIISSPKKLRVHHD